MKTQLIKVWLLWTGLVGKPKLLKVELHPSKCYLIPFSYVLLTQLVIGWTKATANTASEPLMKLTALMTAIMLKEIKVLTSGGPGEVRVSVRLL